MLKFILKRLVNYLVLVFVATSLAYILASVSLSPITRYLNTGRKVDLESIHANLRTYNVDPDTPVLVRYGRWLKGIFLHFDFGKVFPGQENVTTEMSRRIGVSLRLLIIGTILAIIIGVLLGVYSALKQYKVSDQALTLVSFVLLSTPVFLTATMVKFAAISANNFFGISIPTADEYPPGQAGNIPIRILHLLLPTIVLIIGPAGAAFFSRYQRSAMLDVLGSDFIRTAQAKGLSRRRAFYKHGLRTALIPMATFFAFTFGLIVVGATFTEIAFNWHGMGEWAVETINNADINGVAGVTAFVAVMILISGLLSDIAYAVLDPRVRVN